MGRMGGDNGSPSHHYFPNNNSTSKFSNSINYPSTPTSIVPMLLDNGTLLDWLNATANQTQTEANLNGTVEELAQTEDIITNRLVQIIFSILYCLIFVLGVVGNVLVCYVVFRNKAMQTVTNYFITNLALSDILLCILAVPFTPLYTFLERWAFGVPLCHLVPYAQGCSIYISTLTLTAVAIDRFFVIVYPFQPRMKLSVCISIIVSIWVFALLVTMPYGLYMKTQVSPDEDEIPQTYCEEDWPSEYMKKVFSICTTLLQFALPFLIIMFCYACVSIKLNDRAKLKPGSKTSKREEADRDRKKRTNRMLIAMVAVFGISWLPLNLINMINDFTSKENEEWQFTTLIFFISHAIAMSSTCYNPFLYAWLNENFRKEFRELLPCFFGDEPVQPNRNSRYRPPSKSSFAPKHDTNNNNVDSGTNNDDSQLLGTTGTKKNHNNNSNNKQTNLINENKEKLIHLNKNSMTTSSSTPANRQARDVNADYVNVSKAGAAAEPISNSCTSSSSPSTTTTSCSAPVAAAFNRATVVQFSPQKVSPADDPEPMIVPFTSSRSGGVGGGCGAILETHFEEQGSRPLLGTTKDDRPGQIV